MTRLAYLAFGATVLSLTSALPSHVLEDLKFNEHVKRQYTPPYDAPNSGDRAQAVVDAFKLSWEGYYRYAFPNDELMPVTNGFSNSRYCFDCIC
jgi:mannosyl-oligosaccharide alpha-1,2-mannosidase